MANRKTTLITRNSDIINRPLPNSGLLAGEAIVNTADGILLYSGVTSSTTSGWTQAGPTHTESTFFEVGSNLYDLRLRNKITSYKGANGSGLVGKFLSGTTDGFELADISDIAGVDSFVTGGTYNSNTDTITLEFSEGKPNVEITGVEDNYTTGATLINNVAHFDRSNGLSAYTLDLSSFICTGEFTGNTSGNCISDFHVENIHGCSAVTIHSSVQHIGSTASGDLSTAFGGGTIAGGNYSHAEGYNTTASGDYSHAEGEDTEASGWVSHAQGWGTTASGEVSHAQGEDTEASGEASHAQGYYTEASGAGSHAQGYNTEASGNYSHAQGYHTTASGETSHAQGSGTIASGMFSHAQGYGTKAIGNASHAQGNYTNASGNYSHAQGEDTHAIGEVSHAQGSGTEASGDFSHAQGYNTIASGDGSHAQGQNTTASGMFSHAGGGGLYNSRVIAGGETSFAHFRSNNSSLGDIGAMADYSAILGGLNHNIEINADNSAILGGSGNTITDGVTNSVILGGSGISATAADTVYVPNLNISTTNSSTSEVFLVRESDGTINNRSIPTSGMSDNYTTGATLFNNVAYFDRSDGLSAYTLDLSSFICTGDTYTTAFTYNNANELTIIRNQGLQDLSVHIDTFTGLTVDGTLTATTIDGSDILSGGTNLSSIFTTTDYHTDDFSYNPTNNTFSITVNDGTTYNAALDSVSGLSFSNLTAGRVPYVGTGGLLTDDAGLVYDASSDTMTVGSLDVSNNLVIGGDLTVLGDAISAYTSELYIEDNNIILNYNPTGTTNSSSVNAGFTIQDGDGGSGDVSLDIIRMMYLTGIDPNNVPDVSEYIATTGYENRGWITELNDIVIRSNDTIDDGTTGAVNGVRVLAEFDILDGGAY